MVRKITGKFTIVEPLIGNASYVSVKPNNEELDMYTVRSPANNAVQFRRKMDKCGCNEVRAVKYIIYSHR